MHIYILLAHVLSASIWTGGHLILASTVLPRALRAKDPAILLDFESGFEKIGIPALIIQVTSGLWMAYSLVPDIASWFSFEDYVTTSIGLKLLTLGATAGFALNARFRVIPNLTAETLPLMAWHIYTVTILSVVFVILGVGLSSGGY